MWFGFLCPAPEVLCGYLCSRGGASVTVRRRQEYAVWLDYCGSWSSGWSHRSVRATEWSV